MRIDVYLVENNYAPSRQRAQCMIKNGEIVFDGTIIEKSSFSVDETVQHDVKILGESNRFVSRGGLKLEGAIQKFAPELVGKRAIDVGSSTGGFTDCLLQNGVCDVWAVDVGEAQLHQKLLCDNRVHSLEHCNARNLTPTMFPHFFDIAVMDVSFISQTLILPALHSIMEQDGILISLIKPQFEVGPAFLNKHGIVTQESARFNAIRSVLKGATENGFYPVGLMQSPIKGGDGNAEYILYASTNSNKALLMSDTYIQTVIRHTEECL